VVKRAYFITALYEMKEQGRRGFPTPARLNYRGRKPNLGQAWTANTGRVSSGARPSFHLCHARHAGAGQEIHPRGGRIPRFNTGRFCAKFLRARGRVESVESGASVRGSFSATTSPARRCFRPSSLLPRLHVCKPLHLKGMVQETCKHILHAYKTCSKCPSPSALYRQPLSGNCTSLVGQ
jgi:hypothetical protein